MANGAAVVGPGTPLEVLSGKRTLTLKPSDLEHYAGSRASRGNHLPRGFQRVDGLQALREKGADAKPETGA